MGTGWLELAKIGGCGVLHLVPHSGIQLCLQETMPKMANKPLMIAEEADLYGPAAWPNEDMV